jgi:dihydrofolate synthase/folylpolyglutamate synthase
MIDGSHNPQSVRELADTLERIFNAGNLVFVCGVMADKDHAEMLRLVLANKGFHAAAFISVTPDNPRAMQAEALLEEARTILLEGGLVKSGTADYNEACMLRAIEDPIAGAAEAVRIASANNGVVCVFGSL